MDAPELERCPYCGGEAAIERITIGNGHIEAYTVGCDGRDGDGGLCRLNRALRYLKHRTPRIAGCKWNDRAKLISGIHVKLIDERVAVTVAELRDLLRHKELGGATYTPCILNAYLTDGRGRRCYLGDIAVGVGGAGDGILGADITLEISCEEPLGRFEEE